MVFVNERNGEDAGNWRTIDYERNIVFKDIGTRPESIYLFKLIYNNQPYGITTKAEMELNDQNKYIINWHVEKIEAPAEMLKELKQIVSEALLAYGLLYKVERIEKAKIDFPLTYQPH